MARADSTTRKPHQVLMMGLSNSGKTSLLGSIQHALDLNAMDVGADECRIYGRNRAMSELDRLHRAGIREGRLGIKATEEITEYEFVFESARSGFFTRMLYGPAAREHFRMIDGPGGALLPRDMLNYGLEADESNLREFRQRLVRQGRLSDTLILSIDANDDRLSGAFFAALPDLLKEISPSTLPFRTVMILLTKADGFFAPLGVGAERAARHESPIPRARQLMSPVIGALEGAVNSGTTTLLAGWTSAYGFLHDGRANYDPEKDCLLGHALGWSIEDTLNSWRPFNILGWMQYLVCGESRHLWKWRG